MEEHETRVTGTQFVLKFDQQGGEESTVDEELRVVHQNRVRAESKRGEHLERMCRLGLCRDLGRISQRLAGGFLSFDEGVDIKFLILGNEGLSLFLQQSKECVDHNRVELRS